LNASYRLNQADVEARTTSRTTHDDAVEREEGEHESLGDARGKESSGEQKDGQKGRWIATARIDQMGSRRPWGEVERKGKRDNEHKKYNNMGIVKGEGDLVEAGDDGLLHGKKGGMNRLSKGWAPMRILRVDADNHSDDARCIGHACARPGTTMKWSSSTSAT